MNEPKTLIAGDTVKWTESFADYPASTWVLTYSIRGSVKLDIAATADGDNFDVVIAAADSAKLIPGIYTYQATVSATVDDIPERYTVARGQFEILPNLAAQHDGYEARSTWQIILDDCEAALRTWVQNGGPRELTIGGRTQVWDIAQVRSLHSQARQEVAGEASAANLASGKAAGNQIYPEFA